jgi:hypothetical protein
MCNSRYQGNQRKHIDMVLVTLLLTKQILNKGTMEIMCGSVSITFFMYQKTRCKVSRCY